MDQRESRNALEQFDRRTKVYQEGYYTKATSAVMTIMKWTSEQLAYMAGMIDGEGSISIFDSRSKTKGKVYFRNRLILSVYNTNEEVVLWMQMNFGGRVRVKKRVRKDKPCFVWETGWQHARAVLEAVLPYLIIKKSRAELFVEFAKTSKRTGRALIPVEVVSRRKEIVDEMGKLNARGSNALVN